MKDRKVRDKDKCAEKKQDCQGEAAIRESMTSPYTDLAVEARESCPEDNEEIPGVVLEKTEIKGIQISKVHVLDQKGEAAIGKPKGDYITIEWPKRYGEEEKEELCRTIASYVKHLLKKMTGKEEPAVLAAGLGNSRMTADSLGPKVLEKLRITRTMYEDGKVSGLTPGVLAQTGMESAEILRGVIRETKPDALLVIDALAARSVHRLGTTLQITDTGIQPGSGVGNHRNQLTKETLGIPVIALGVPTVVSGVAIVYDTVQMLRRLQNNGGWKKENGLLSPDLPEQEQYFLLRELMEPELGPMFVTAKDVDDQIEEMSDILAEGLNECFYRTDRS